jgi:uncharacterized protein involved in response to NO
MQNIVDLEQELKTTPLWRQAFRPFFLFGCLFAVLALSVWAAVLTGKFSFSPYGGITFWHGHEMLFGFVAAIIVGFLLTAVQSWTGLRATNGKALTGLFMLWLLGRILMLYNPTNIDLLVALVDLGFLLVSGFLLAKLVLNVKQYRNLIFVPVLLLLTVSNGFTHWSVLSGEFHYYNWGIYSTVMLITLLMTVVAGRVFPMFTANGTGTKKVNNLPWLEKIVIGLAMLIVLLFISTLNSILPHTFMASIFGLAALSHTIRALRWRPFVTFGAPLVWSLHLAYWFIPLSLGLFSLHYFTLNYVGYHVAASTALHGLTAGAMSSLILAMIARISLGHSGRPLQAHWLVKYAFALALVAGVSRLMADFVIINWPEVNQSINLYIVSALLWVFAYLIYLLVYLPILTSARPDGRPG